MDLGKASSCAKVPADGACHPHAACTCDRLRNCVADMQLTRSRTTAPLLFLLSLQQDELCRFLGNAIINTGASVSSTGRPVTYCRVQRDKNFAFVEVRSAEEASNCMALDGLVFKDAPLKVGVAGGLGVSPA